LKPWYIVRTFVFFSTLLLAKVSAQPVSFQAWKTVVTPNNISASAFAVADFNGDGKPDLVTASLTSSSPPDAVLRTFPGKGDGIFQTPGPPLSFCPAAASYCGAALVNSNANAMQVADWNHDGKPDLLVAGYEGLTVLVGNGDGTFRVSQWLPAPAGNFYATAAIADFTGDGVPDIVIALTGAPGTYYDLQLFPGKGDGTFLSPIDLSIGGYPLGSADFNRDGKPDLLVSGFDGTAYAYLGIGNGAFRMAWQSGPRLTTINSTLGDVNADGRIDFVTCAGWALVGPPCSVFLGNGDGSFRLGAESFSQLAPPAYYLNRPAAVNLADFNGDGKLDLSVGLIVMPGNGDGTFQSPVPFGAFVDHVLAADLNSDGKMDLIAEEPFPNGVSTLISDSPGRLPSVTVISAASGTSQAVMGSLASLFGANLAGTTATAAPTNGAWPTTLGGVNVNIHGIDGIDRAAPLVFVSLGQINLQVPPDTPVGCSAFNVIGQGQAPLEEARCNPVSAADLAFFTADGSGTGVAAAVVLTADAAGKITSYPAFTCAAGKCAPVPIHLSGSTATYIELFLTGLPLDFATPGWIMSAYLNGGSKSGGKPVPVTYLGPQGTYPGLSQLNVLLPNSYQGLGVSQFTLEIRINQLYQTILGSSGVILDIE
jgi:uncharacterized protein (TIGR03437 family)